jgi:hypothetical protein
MGAQFKPLRCTCHTYCDWILSSQHIHGAQCTELNTKQCASSFCPGLGQNDKTKYNNLNPKPLPLQVLLVLAKKQPPAGRKLLVIGTSSAGLCDVGW